MNDMKNVRTALARSLADHKIADDVIDLAARQLAAAKYPIRNIDVCPYGICIDYFIDGKEWWRTLQELTTIPDVQLKKIEVFPYGIINPDLFHIRVTHSPDALPNIRG